MSGCFGAPTHQQLPWINPNPDRACSPISRVDVTHGLGKNPSPAGVVLRRVLPFTERELLHRSRNCANPDGIEAVLVDALDSHDHAVARARTTAVNDGQRALVTHSQLGSVRPCLPPQRKTERSREPRNRLVDV